MSVNLYVEGGGEGKLKSRCRKAFSTFIKNAGLGGRMPKIIPCGRRDRAYAKFKAAHVRNKETALLVDAEAPVGNAKPWQHLKNRDGWDRPMGATDDQCHLMVEVMESWFLADRGALAAFYGQRFREQALPQNPNIEQVTKQDVLGSLESATRNTTKGSYSKGKHSFEILGNLDPARVMDVSNHAKRFIDVLQAKAQA